MEGILSRLLTAEVFALVLVFCRMGSAMMLLPGFGERYVPARARLMLALIVTLIVAPLVLSVIPRLPADPFNLFVLVGGEVLVGLFIGLSARLLMTALEIGATVITYQIGLASAQIFNPMLAEQGSIIGILLVLSAVAIIFQTDMHHLLLRGAVDSYSLFVPGRMPPMGDFSQMIVNLVGKSFLVGLQLSAPFLLFGIVTNVAFGLISRVMPQMQVFFINLPLQLTVGFLILAATLTPVMAVFMRSLSDQLATFLLPR